MNWWGGTFVDCAWPLSWPCSAGLISRLKNTVDWFVVREKHCSDWKNKLKSTDYKPDEQSPGTWLSDSFHLVDKCMNIPALTHFLHMPAFTQVKVCTDGNFILCRRVSVNSFYIPSPRCLRVINLDFFRSLYIKETVIKKSSETVSCCLEQRVKWVSVDDK
jgi:hypothetical protein